MSQRLILPFLIPSLPSNNFNPFFLDFPRFHLLPILFHASFLHSVLVTPFQLLQRTVDTTETKAASIPAEPAGWREVERDGNEAWRKRIRAKSKVDGWVSTGQS